MWFGDIIIVPKKAVLILAYQPAITKKTAEWNFAVMSDKYNFGKISFFKKLEYDDNDEDNNANNNANNNNKLI